MKKILTSICATIVIFIVGLVADNPLIASLCVVPLILLAISYLRKPQPTPTQTSAETPQNKRKTLHTTFVVGTQYYDAEQLISALDFNDFEETEEFKMSRKQLIEESNYDKIWQFEPYDLEAFIIPEPTNEHDPNALQVIAVYNGKEFKIGYVPKEKTQDVKDAEKFFLQIVGGNFKQLNDDDELIKGKSDYSFNLEYIK